ncbi:UNVERIFIED_CONTAM: Rab GTPase-activating protein 1-like protein [Gekko kuhli]
MAYSVYDEEIGYCQGHSFLVAVLLLHMPEEQAFCVLVKIMYDYGLRDLYKNNLEDLRSKFYQLERLMQEQLPDLYSHFLELNLEAHMYASQWFLTLFTAKFPLCMVFHIIDLLLCEWDSCDILITCRDEEKCSKISTSGCKIEVNGHLTSVYMY